jgi:DNA-binding XRE family transcriptional regulator
MLLFYIFLFLIVIMKTNLSPVALKAWRQQNQLTQTQLGLKIGLDKFAITNIERGQRKISQPEQLLLKLLIYGELPFASPNKNNTLDFSEQEWRLIHSLSLREGFKITNDWLVMKIRIYLAQIPKESLPPNLMVAEEKSPT